MRLTVGYARGLAERVMAALGHETGEAQLIADHLIDCELRGLHYGGLPRALSIAERIGRSGKSRDPIRILHETPLSARLDGGDQLGYLVAHQATRLAIVKALSAGIAVVGASNTWYTGMLSYYAEMAAAEGLVSVIASHTAPWVAPDGASEGRFGTNPICFGFPSADAPIIWDIGTSAIIHAQATLARRIGEALPDGVAFDAAGRPTRDPAAALAGAFAAWGGHKGSGLGLVVQLLGGLAGAPFVPPDLAQFGFFMLALRPDLLGSADAFNAGAAQYANYVRAARPVAGGPAVRMPFDRSRQERQERMRRDAIDIEEDLHTALVAVAERR
ncbi:MAG TPA: Ldh family oxidoreductase [Stellaceae bacterium]|nr:Ldh family oxidoreductase [Stellaceae bacterium]